MEDTFNLLGHALRKAVRVLARQQGRGLAEVASEAGAEVVAGSTSLKAALDEDWDQPEDRDHGLRVVLKALEGVEALVAAQPPQAQDPFVRANLAVARQVQEQDVVENAEGEATIRHGVAEDRRISVEDPDMRHGRKTSKLEFALDWERQEMRCPNDVVLSFTPGGTVQFPAEICAQCPLKKHAPAVLRVAASTSTRMSSSWWSCALGSRRRRARASYESG